MVFFARGFRGALLVLACSLAACGGGGSHSVLPSAIGDASAARTVDAVNPIAPVVYVSGQGSVYAYPIAAVNADPPLFSVAGEYNASDGTQIAGIATDRKATLYVLTNYGPLTPGGPGCHVLRYDTANGVLAAPVVVYRCAPGVFYAAGIASGPNGEIDVLDTVDNAGQTGFQVERFLPGSGASAPSRLKLPSNRPYTAIGAGAAGNIFVGYNPVGPSGPTIEKYGAGAVGTASAVASYDLSPFTYLSAISSGRGEVYVTVGATSGPLAGVSDVQAINPTLTTRGDALGTGNAGTTFGPSAVDQNGNLYAGWTDPSGTLLIRAYLPSPSAAFVINTSLNDPVRRPNPAGAVVTGVAVAQ